MSISEINDKIAVLEAQLQSLQNERKLCVQASTCSFCFTDSWRDKKSYTIRIPILAKNIMEISQKIAILKSDRDVEIKKIEYNKLVEMEKEKIKLEKLSYIPNPIATLEV